ncbi:ATP-binding cassette domain-containing protein [Rhodovulum sulfidophilum]|uniref:ATP-binding cassette domain-containing protein n=2 Tax=Paracoccaceae TaxID=31989 RepID=UPI00192681FD|nr:ATP-binding cassette domain-containing protein [Rhodovulum sulfidophilum]
MELVFQTGDGPLQALSDVSLDVGRGEFVSLIGPSGCGKTTFLRCVAALEHPTGGRPRANGNEPRQCPQATQLRLCVPSGGALPLAGIARNIRLALEVMGYPKAEQAAQVQKLVDLAGLGNKSPWQLSGGMQQWASIAPRWPSMPISC